MKKVFGVVAFTLGILFFAMVFLNIQETQKFQVVYLLQIAFGAICILQGLSYFKQQSNDSEKGCRHVSLDNDAENLSCLNSTIRDELMDFLSKKPRCFSDFNIEDATDVKSNWVSGVEFSSKYVSCPCGNSLLNIYASQNEGITLAPILLECENCQLKEEIFNPEVHGWNGENGDNCSMIGKFEPRLVNSLPSKIVAEYSYQALENYEELIQNGIQNPEDYFDVFSIYTCDEDGNLKEVVSYECA